jgi:pimeloyl-ACP methyl ester carboxylesterase
MPAPRSRPHWSDTLKDFTALGPRERISPALVAGCPRGDGGAVLVLPGILHGDAQTALLRKSLAELGYQVFGWELGPNAGPSRQLMEGVTKRLTDLATEHGTVRLVGYSMGGLFARWLAHRRTNLVRSVVTIMSPFASPLDSAWFPIRPFLPFWRDVDIGALSYMIRQPPPVPWASIYSKRDGIVWWKSCVDDEIPERCVEVQCRHRLAPVEAEVFRWVTACLSEM